jgi:hypothetical protein
MRAPEHGPMTSRELVEAVANAGLGYDCDPGRLRSFLADLGFDPLDYIRARRDVKRADPDDYAAHPTLNLKERHA